MKRQRNRGRGWALAGAAALMAAAALAGDLPFIESFETQTSVVLHNHNDWRARRQQDAQVQGNVVFAGSQAGVVATNALLWQNFGDATATNVWIDFYARQQHPPNNDPPELAGSVAAAFYVGTDGKIRAISNATWVTLDVTVPSNAWRRYTVNLDYGAQEWSLYVADEVPNRLATAVAEGLKFRTGSTNAYLQTFRVKN